MKLYELINSDKYHRNLKEGAPELLKAEMPLIRHIERELAQHGVQKNDPEYQEKFKHAMAVYRKFGNVEAFKKGVTESQHQYDLEVEDVPVPYSNNPEEAEDLITVGVNYTDSYDEYNGDQIDSINVYDLSTNKDITNLLDDEALDYIYSEVHKHIERRREDDLEYYQASRGEQMKRDRDMGYFESKQGVAEGEVQKTLDPDLYEDIDGRLIARVAKSIVPDIKASYTDEGYVYLKTKDGFSLVIGSNLSGGAIDINIGTGHEPSSSGPHKGAVTKIIETLYKTLVKQYGTPTEQGSLSIKIDASSGVWERIASKLGLKYEAVTDSAGGSGTRSQDVSEGIARNAKEKKLYELLEAWGHFITFKTVDLGKTNAVDQNAQQEISKMRQHYLGPVMNGMTFGQITKGDLWQNPKVIPHLLKYIYQGIPFIEERIKKFIVPNQQQTYLSALDKIKTLYKEVVAQYSGQQGVSEEINSYNTNEKFLNEDSPRVRKVEKERPDGSISTTYEVLDWQGRTIKTGMSRPIARSYLKAHWDTLKKKGARTPYF